MRNHPLTTALYLTGPASLALNTVLIWPLLARQVDDTTVGGLTVALSIIAMATPLATAGLHVYVLRDAADSADSSQLVAQRVAAASLALLLLVSIVAGVLMITTVAAMSVVFVTAANGTAVIGASLSRGLGRPGRYALQLLGSQTLSLLVAAIALSYGKDLRWALAAYGAMCLLVGVLASPFPSALGSLTEWVAPLKTVLRFSLPLIPHLVLLVAMLQGVRVIVAGVAGFEAAAHFQFAAMIGGLPVTASMALNGLWAPRTYHVATEEEFAASWRRYAQRLVATGLLLSACVVVGSALLIGWFLPPDYPVVEILIAIALFLPGGVLQAHGDTLATICLRSYRSRIISAATTSGAAASWLLASITSIWPGRIWAPAGAVSIGLAVRAAVAAVLVSRAGLSVRRSHTSLLPVVGTLILTTTLIIVAHSRS